MKLHPIATTLSLLIYAEHLRQEELEYAVHEVLTRAVDLMDWSDERKADLYARLAESLNKGMPYAEMEKACSTILWDNQAEFAHG